MQKSIPVHVDRIRISRCISGEHVDSFVDDPKEIDRIIRLIGGKSEKVQFFIDSEQLVPAFRIELYNGQGLVERMSLIGEYLRRKSKWHRMADSSLKDELIRQTQNALEAKIGPCVPRER